MPRIPSAQKAEPSPGSKSNSGFAGRGQSGKQEVKGTVSSVSEGYDSRLNVNRVLKCRGFTSVSFVSFSSRTKRHSKFSGPAELISPQH